MRKLAPWVALGTLTLAVLGVSGCKDASADSCPNVQGVFLASYQMLAGSCGTFEGNALSLAKDEHGMVTKVENRLSDSVTTEVIFKGCTLSVKQSVDAMGARMSEISGDLDVEDSSQLSGMMTRTEYMPDGAIKCNGVYDAHYTRQDVVVGGAVQHAGTVQ